MVAFKNCAPFRTCDVVINNQHVEKVEDLDIVMPMYNLLEYSDNYENSRGSLDQFKRDESPDATQMLLLIHHVYCTNQNLLAELITV